MSCLYIPKKLKELPSSSKKAWNSFTSTLSPKLRHLTKTTTHRFLDLRHNKRHRRTPPSSGGTFYYYKQYNNYQHLQQPRTPYSGEPNISPASVYVDRLFEESYSSTPNKADAKVTMEPSSTNGGIRGTTSNDGGRKKKRKKVRHNNNSNSNSNNSNNDWKEYVASMPNIRGVDERAEEFISKFRQDMQIQREQSLIEFHEMLARSA